MTPPAPRKPNHEGAGQIATMFDRGFQHFLICLHTPSKMARGYPTRDTHCEEQEQEFLRGFYQAQAEHVAASQCDDFGDGRLVLEGY